MTNDPQLLVLISLASGPRHGYAIQQDLEQAFATRLGPGTLYGAIARLETRGLIHGLDDDGRRRPYALTEAGSRELRERLTGLSSLVAVGLSRVG